MRQSVLLTDWNETTPAIRDFIEVWKKRKGYTTQTLNIGEAIEYIIGYSRNLKIEYSDGRFFNNILINGESTIAWDGRELIDSLFYEVEQITKHLLSVTGTFGEQL